ncbi:MAG: IPT/TIG domain-containing protein [Acidobacteriota bacterium]
MNGDGIIEEPPDTVKLEQVSPIGGALAGGITVTITGSGFQDGAVAYFGSQQSERTNVESETTMTATLPSALEPGSVAVTVVNIDGSQETLDGGFTYVTMQGSDHADVQGVSPLTVIENGETEVTIRGRNLIEAYNDGLVALRGPNRVTLAIADVAPVAADESGIESLTFTVTISASPALQPHERIAIQVLASRRSGARSDLIPESSKQMFTVLPKEIPVPLAISPSLNADKSTLVMVVGRNLEGCRLQFASGTKVHLQKSDDRSICGIVSVSKELSESATETQFSILDSLGNVAGEYSVSIRSSEQLKQSDLVPSLGPLPEGATKNPLELQPSNFLIDLVGVPEQQFIGPKADDSKVYDLRGEMPTTQDFIWFDFEIVIADIFVILPIVNEVYLVPLFDGGGSDLQTPILAEVGKLFPVRGTGILVAARVEITIHITVILIIAIYIEIWPFGLFNEFEEEFPNAIGSIVIGIIIEVEIIIVVSFLSALVLPDGSLRLLFVFNLTVGIDFTFSADGHHLGFEPNFTHSVRFSSILPFTDPLPCSGRFQLAEDNGQTVFTDSIGGSQSFYFGRSAGECCVPWNFNVELVRFSPGGNEEVIQPSFEASMCITAEPSAHLMNIIITSTPPPQGVPPTLVMNLADAAILEALAQPVDASGNPTGPAQDVRDLGYDREFYLDLPPTLLDPTTLPDGNAFAIQEGGNLIRAAITSVRVLEEGDEYNFWPGTVLGFDIIRFLAEGQPPRIQAGGLPLQVNADADKTITIEPVLAYRDQNNNLIAAPVFRNNLQPATDVWEVERYEPFETDAQREFLMAVKVGIPDKVDLPVTLNFTVNPGTIKLFADGSTTPKAAKPLDVSVFGSQRSSDKPGEFFTGQLAQASLNQTVTASLTISDPVGPDDLVAVPTLSIKPNVKEDMSLTPRRLVPPGPNVTALSSPSNRAASNVLLTIPFKCVPADSTLQISCRKPQINLVVRNEETLEEYLRVVEPVQTILTNAGNYFLEFGKNLLLAVTNHQATPISLVLKNNGEDLWAHAADMVQSPFFDDRPLYWARLQGIGALRAYMRRNPGVSLNISQFELPSRGLDPTDGGIKFINAPAGARKVIVTGFDPFGLLGGLSMEGPDSVERSNPSGLITLSFDGTTISIPNHGDFFLRTAIFPVRYRDFNNSIVENAVVPSLSSIVMFITTSDNSDTRYYDIERWAARKRVNLTDNNNEQGVEFPVLPAGSDFLESTLPYELVITTSESLSGPSGPAAFVIDQSYLVSGTIGDLGERRRPGTPPPLNTTLLGRFRPEPIGEDLDGHRKVADGPSGISDEGSGGNYLSNEIFYRVALKRKAVRPGLPSGHFHVPSTKFDPRGTGQALINGVTQALGRLFSHGSRFSGPNALIFPPPVIINSTAETPLAVTNNSLESLSIATIDVTAPFSVVAPNSLPIAVGPGSSVTLTARFTPTVEGSQAGKIVLHESSGEILLEIGVSGEGIPSQPPPTMSGFTPLLAALGDTVNVSGQYFTRTTSVKVGNHSVPFTVLSDTQIELEPNIAVSGFITVVTLFGTVISASVLRVIFRPPRD